MRKFYITTSIAYANAFPHIGFALEAVQADVLARYHRIIGDDVFFLTGTDEHGIKIAEAAKKAGKTPKELVDKISNRFKELEKILNISNDDFIKTTDKKRHWPTVKKIWRKIENKGDIYKKKYEGLYCSGCEAFIAERELIKGKCPIHKKKPEVVREENYFFRLSKYAGKIEKILEKDKIKIIPKTRKNEALGFIRRKLTDISFSRSRSRLKWGIEGPGDSTQTIYVWADALLNYVSALGYPDGKEFKKYWPADVHCVGKDILKFHALIWPAILLSLGLELPKKIFVHGFINIDKQKISKSLGNIVDPFELVGKYGTDAVRYFLLREIPPAEDGDFTYKKFEERYNSDLANGLGNLVARVITLAKIFNFQFSIFNKFSNPNFQKRVDKILENYKKALEEFKFNESLKAIWGLISFCDKYIEQTRPWEDVKNKPSIINDLLISLDSIAQMLEPFLPETSERIKKEIERDKRTGKFVKRKRGNSLFPRLNLYVN